jgi:hypothetical protein
MIPDVLCLLHAFMVEHQARISVRRFRAPSIAKSMLN